MLEFSYIFILFISYAFVGWLVEVICCSLHDKRFVLNRGFLLGPYCPIYGFAAIVITYFLKKYLSDPLALFIMAVVLCSVLEYTTSWAMEKLFKARWWDYSTKKFNLNGRIALDTSISFGLLGLVMMYGINPFYVSLLNHLPHLVTIIVAITLFIIFLVDVIISVVTITQLRMHSVTIGLKDATGEISKQVKEKLYRERFLFRRLLNAFPKAKSTIKEDLLEKIKKEVKKAKNKKKSSS